MELSVRKIPRQRVVQRKPQTRIVPTARPKALEPREVTRAFRALLDDGARFRPAGDAKDDPALLLAPRYRPRHTVSLFGVDYYLTDFRFEESLDFFVVYVSLSGRNGGPPDVYPRIVYKDSSLVWRVASHVVRTDDEDWIGKGDVRWMGHGDDKVLASDEDSTNLPYEVQGAFDMISRRGKKRKDDDAVRLVLRNGPENRVEPYADFSAPRRRAAERTPINGGRPVARILRPGEPESLRIARGFEPDFADGVLEVDESGSRLYGGKVRKYRILSSNRQVQWQFVSSPTHVWLNPPQALTTEITSYGIRALHVPADEDIFIPGYEYHYMGDDIDPSERFSQIPAGFAGAPSPVDVDRADASAWIERLPVIREFRAQVLGKRRRR